MKNNHWNLQYLEQVDSTNDWIWNSQSQCKHQTAVYTFHQTNGRGQRSNKWENVKGKGLALSLFLKEVPTHILSAMPLVVGLSVSQSLETFQINNEIKWCNDIVVQNKKLSGILCESRWTDKGADLVLGIGINLMQTKKDFQKQNLPWAISLQMLENEIDAMLLISRILSCWDNNYLLLLEDGFSGEVLTQYKNRCAMLGKEILVLHRDGTTEQGVAVDIGSDGSLLYQSKGKISSLQSGEVSVRGLYGYNP